MNRKPSIRPCLYVLSLCFARTCAGNVFVDNGTFYATVDPPGLSTTNTLILGPVSPFVNSQTATFQAAYTSVQHVLSWSGNDVNYRLDTQQHLQGFQGSVSSTGNFRITPSIDSVLTIHEEYAYNHPATLLGAATVGARIRLATTNTTVYADGYGNGTFDLGPPIGTLVLDGTIPLNANTAYIFSYVMVSHNFDPPPPDAVWAGTGFLDLTVRPIPEPTALFPLALLALFRRSRSHR